MSYAFNVNRVTISGSCFGGAEEWSTGFWMGSETADAGDPQGAAEQIAGYWRVFFELAAHGVSSGYITTQVKVAQHIAETEATDLQSVDFYTVSPLMDGGGTSGALPAQISLAMTLTSELQRGTGSKGRMYLPGINTAVQTTDGHLISSYVATLSNNFKTFLDSVNTAAGTSGKLILASKGHKIPGPIPNDYLGGVSAWVTGCRIGNVYDTQRRRRNGLTEAYETRVLAP